MSDTTHYVASIKVEKIVKTDPRPSGDRGLGPLRTKGDVAHITISAETIEGLRSKIAAHVDLIDEDGVELQ